MILAHMLAAATVATPPLRTSPPPPAIPSAQKQDVASQTIGVEVTADHRLLWHGDIRVAGSAGGGSYYQSLRQALPDGCANPAPTRAAIEDSLRVTLNINSYVSGLAGKPVAAYSVDWMRPGACNPATTQLTNRISGDAPLDRGRPLLIRGDAGLELRLTLR